MVTIVDETPTPLKFSRLTSEFGPVTEGTIPLRGLLVKVYIKYLCWNPNDLAVVHLGVGTSGTRMFIINNIIVRVDEGSSVKAKLDRNIHGLPFGTDPIAFFKGLLPEPPKENREQPSSRAKWTDPAPREKSSDLGTMNSIGMSFILL